MAEYERTLIAERMRRGRQAKRRSGQLLPWTRAPYGSLRDPDRPRDASRVRLDPVQAAVVEHMFAWYTDAGQAPSLYQVANRLSDAHMPTPSNPRHDFLLDLREGSCDTTPLSLSPLVTKGYRFL